ECQSPQIVLIARPVKIGDHIAQWRGPDAPEHLQVLRLSYAVADEPRRLRQGIVPSADQSLRSMQECFAPLLKLQPGIPIKVTGVDEREAEMCQSRSIERHR